MTTEDLASKLLASGALLEAQAALGRVIEDRALARTDLDPTTADLLVRLRLAEGHHLRGVELCHQLLKSPSHISRMVDRVEQEGLVRREPDPKDRRAQLITLTETGMQAVDDFAPHLIEVLDRTIHRNLTQTETRTLIQLLARISRAAHELLDGQSATIDDARR